jgi:hypothetical protein
MSDRVCIRGCTRRGEHYAACPSFGTTDGDCKGCVESEARDHSMICNRCHGRLRRALDATPDLLALIRSKADPLKAIAYDAERSSGGPTEAPAPVAADLIDAGDAVNRILRYWTGYEDRPLPPGLASDQAHDMAEWRSAHIVATLDTLTNNGGDLARLWADVIEMPTEADGWTIAKALARWPLEDRSFIAAQPCPMDYCGLVTVRVTPPRRARGATRFQCTSCDWDVTDAGAVDDGDGFWTEVFTRRGRAA